jgi:hypothetical protein
MRTLSFLAKSFSNHVVVGWPPSSDIIAAEIAEELQAALWQFAEIANDLKK